MAKPAFDPTKPFEAVPQAQAVKPAFDPTKPFEAVQEPSIPLSEKIETGARSVVEGMSFGVSEPFISKTNAIIGNIISSGFDAEDLKDFLSKSVDAARIEEERKRDIQRRKQLEEALPLVAVPSEIAGSLLTGFGASSAAKALAAGTKVPAIARVLTAPQQAVTGLAETVAAQVPTEIGKAATRGAIEASAPLAIKASTQIPTGISAPEEFDYTGAALTGAKFGAGVTGAVQLVKAVPGAVKKMLSTLGSSEEAIGKYIKDPKVFERVQSKEDLKTNVDLIVGKLNDDIAEAKLSVTEAQKVFNETKKKLQTAAGELKIDAKDVLSEAQKKFDDAVKLERESVKAGLDATRVELRDEAVSAVGALKDNLKRFSAESYKILQQSGRSISVKPAIKAAEQALEDLKIQGQAPTAGASAQAYGKIKNYIDDLKRFKDDLSASDAKKKIQQLDQDWQSLVNAGDFTSAEQNALRKIRAAFDDQLKDIPEYAEIMKQTSSAADLLQRTNKVFGNEASAASVITKIDKVNQDINRNLLIELGLATGRNFEESIAGLGMAQKGLLPGRIETQLGAQPVGATLRQAQMEVAELRRPTVKQAMVEQSPELLRQQAAIERQQILLKQLQEQKKALGPFVNEASNINAINGAIRGKNPQYQVYLKNLSEMGDQDFVQAIQDLKTVEQFDKEFFQGSRNVNLWALLAGTGVAAISQDPTFGFLALGAGAKFGGLVDRYGPKMTKQILDGYLKIQGLPTVQKLERVYSNLPKEALNELKSELIKSVNLAKPENVVVDAKEAPMVVNDIQRSNLSSVEKARLIQSINREEPINSMSLSRIMIGKDMAKPKQKAAVPVPKPEQEAIKEDRPAILKALDKVKE